MPGCHSAGAARHLQILIEEIEARPNDFPLAVLSLLAIGKVYDRVEHDWLFKAYEAFGVPPRFLALLRIFQDSPRLRGRYIVNGFLTLSIHLSTRLSQGNPLPSKAWLLSFQPFQQCAHYAPGGVAALSDTFEYLSELRHIGRLCR